MIKKVGLLCLSLSMFACNNQTSMAHIDAQDNKQTQTTKQGQNHTKPTHSIENINTMAHVYISTADNQAITSKDEYLPATINIDGLEEYADYTGNAKIRGRGNSTWTQPKKPYKIKLDDKASLLGMLPEKDWVLLANYFDPTLMLNATAMKIGQQLDIAYVNHIMPVDVTINGTYQGQYNLTEQVEVKKNRINVKGGVLLELDRYYNDDNKFKSAVYNLPVNVKYPKNVDTSLLKRIKHDVDALETLMDSSDYPHNNYADFFDKKAFADYFIVYMLSANREIEQPKSIYLHQKKGSKQFVMGPLWDFDWGFGFEDGKKPHFSEYNQVLFDRTDDGVGDGLTGSIFFKKILSDPEVASLIQQRWQAYRKNHFDDLLTYLDTYHDKQHASRKQDYQLWQTGSGDIDADYQLLRTWLEKRAEFLDGYVEGML